VTDADDRMQALAHQLRQAVRRHASGVSSALLDPNHRRAADELAELIGDPRTVDPRALQALGIFHLARFQLVDLPDGQDDLTAAMSCFAAIHDRRPDLIPEGLREFLSDSPPAEDVVGDGADRGTGLLRRALADPDPSLLDAAIDQLRRERTEPGLVPSARAAMAANLGTALIARFAGTREPADLDASITAFTDATEQAPAGDGALANYLSQLGAALRESAQSTGEHSAMDAAVAIHRRAVTEAEEGRWTVQALHNLGNALLDRHNLLGAARDAAEAVEVLQRACARLTDSDPDGHPHAGLVHNSLGIALRTRFQRYGELDDLRAAIEHFQVATEHADAPLHISHAFNNLGTSLAVSFEAVGELAELDRAVQVLRRSLDLVEGTPEAAAVQCNLGNALETRFEQVGDVGDLQAAVTMHQQAVASCAEGHPDLPLRLTNLAFSLASRFDRFGDEADLQGSLSAAERSVRLGTRATERPALLANLGNLLGTSFEYTDALADLDAALVALTRAADAVPEDHPDRARYLNNVALAWRQRFERTNDGTDLSRAVDAHRLAVELARPGSPELSGYRSNLATTLRTRHHTLNDPRDLDLAATQYEQALGHIGKDHPDRPGVLANLGDTLVARARARNGAVREADLSRGHGYLVTAVDRLPSDHPGRALALFGLGTWAEVATDHALAHGDTASADRSCAEGLHALAASVAVRPAPLSLRVDAARSAAGLARRCGHLAAASAAHRIVLALLPKLTSPRLARRDQESVLARLGGLGSDAAECLIHDGDLGEALGFLEAARSVLWTRRTQSRTLADRLAQIDPALSRRLAYLARLLEGAHAWSDRHGQPTHPAHPAATPVEAALRIRQESVRRVELSREWHRLRARAVDIVDGTSPARA
jgi:tetratricopeptide (TPR) repeat protein